VSPEFLAREPAGTRGYELGPSIFISPESALIVPAMSTLFVSGNQLTAPTDSTPGTDCRRSRTADLHHLLLTGLPAHYINFRS
jgi:hypothetical protein